MTLPARHPVLERVAEVVVGSDAGGWSYGSGYLLGARLVLTARHLLDDGPPDGRVSVRLAGEPALHPADVVWSAPVRGADLALLRLTGTLPPRRSRPPVLGVLHADPARTVPVTVTGFPSFAGLADPVRGDIRDSYQVTAEVATHSFTKTRRLELRPHSRPRTSVARWRGVSGGAVFAENALIGVVVTADPDAPALHATPLAALADDYGFGRLLAHDGVPPEPRPVRRATHYSGRIRQLASQVGELRDRTAERADLEVFARSDQPYRWIVGPPWAGKTALAAHFAAHPPPDVDVVAFFVSRSFGEQTRQFQQEVCDQLAALVDEPAGVFSGQSALDSLWERACGRATATGRHLLLLVDGLDENDESPPIAALLPAETGSYGHVLVLSREMPPVPAAVPLSHPLRTEGGCPRIRLSSTGFADRLRDRATDELTSLLPDRDVRTVLGALAVGGPMTVDDISTVIAAGGGTLDPYDVRTVVGTVPSRVLSSLREGSAERLGFAHDELRRATADAIGPAVAGRHRAALRTWAAEFARRGWPDDTPEYLVAHYPTALAADTDPAALAALPSPDRVAMWQRRTGHDGLAAQEITDVLNALAAMGADALGAACVLAMRRYRLLEIPADPSHGFPAALVVAWAEQGQWPRAEYLAPVIWHSVRAYADLAAVAARDGNMERAHRLVQRARAAALRDPGGGVWSAPRLAALARVVHGTGAEAVARELLGEAEHLVHVAPPRPGTDLMAVALAQVAEAHAVTGDHTSALRVVQDAERLADGSGSGREALLGRIAFSSAMVRGVEEALGSFPPPHTPAGRARVYAEFARAASLTEGVAEGRRLLRTAEETLGRLPGPRLRDPEAHPPGSGADTAAWWQLLTVLLDLADVACGIDAGLARRVAEKVERELESMPTAGAAESHLGRLAGVYQLLGEPHRAAELIDAVSGRQARLRALVRCAEAASETGADEEAWAHLERAGEVAAAIDEPRHQGDPRELFALAVARCGRPDRAERILRDSSPPRRHFWESLALAEAIAEVGRFDQAEALFALAGQDTDQAERTAVPLARGAGRAGDVRLVRAFASRCGAKSRYFLLQEASIGAAEGGHFALAAHLLSAGREELRASGGTTRRGKERDPAAAAASLAVRHGEQDWAEEFVRLIGVPDMFVAKVGPSVRQAALGDLDAAERTALAVSHPADRAEALTAVAEIAVARGQHEHADRLLDRARQAIAGWTDAAKYARTRGCSDTAVAAVGMGRLSCADELLRLLADASPDHRVPALAARAEACARGGHQEHAVALLEEAFGCLHSRKGGGDEARALAAFVASARAVDPALCRQYVLRLLAARPHTPACLAAVALADPRLAPLTMGLLVGDDPPGDTAADGADPVRPRSFRPAAPST